MKHDSFNQIFLVGCVYLYIYMPLATSMICLSCPHVGSLSVLSQQHARHDDAWSISVASVEQLLNPTTSHDGFHGFTLSQAVSPLMAGMAAMGAGPKISGLTFDHVPKPSYCGALQYAALVLGWRFKGVNNKNRKAFSFDTLTCFGSSSSWVMLDGWAVLIVGTWIHAWPECSTKHPRSYLYASCKSGI